MFKRNIISAAALITMGAAGGGAWAQDANTTGDKGDKLERVEVTGTRLKTIGAEASSPITTVTKAVVDTIQPVAVEDLMRGMPSAYPAIGPTVNNGSNGTATVDLRGMGSNRTLVLINGKRFVPATLTGTVDTNSVPISLLERVDLVTGGASAVYGADAVAGVVNFVLKRNFSGIEARTLYSVSEKGDAGRYKSDFTMGTNLADGRGNVTLSIGTTRTNPLRLADRDYATTVISSSTGNPGGYSGTAVPAIWSGMPGALKGSKVIDTGTGLLRAAVTSGPPDGYNTNPPNYFETPLNRTQITALGHFAINDHIEAYAELFNTRSNVTLNLAPSGTFGVALAIPIGNPYITPAVRTQLCAAYGISTANCVAGSTTEFTANIGRRFVEAGPRIYNYDNTTAQYTTGLRGDIAFLDTWNYDIYYQSGRSDQLQTTANGFSNSRLQQAVRAVNTTTCEVNTGGCVPINLFGAAGTITPAMLAYLSIPTFATTTVQQQVTSASANGEIGFLRSPAAKNPMSLAVGLEARRVFGGNKSDAVIQTQGELLGSGAPTPDRSGTLSFNEAYVEAKMPVVENKPLIYSMNVEGAYRETQAKTSVGADQHYGTWKAGADWAPIKSLRFRGEQQLAIRAPNVNELFAPVTTGLSTITADPCAGTGIVTSDAGKAGTLTNLCQLTGVPTSQIGGVAVPSSNQVNNTSGGNPNLVPEKAHTTTLGFVWEPDFVDNLAVNLDYWKIKIDGEIGSATANQVTSGCYDPTLNPGLTYNSFCQSIQRDPGNGSLNGVGSKGIITQSTNLGTYNYSGIDVGVNYRLPMKKVNLPNLGRVDLGLQLSYLNRADITTAPGVPTIQQAGYYGVDVGNPYPKIRFSQTGLWNIGDYTLGYNWRYIGRTSVQQGETVLASNSSIKAVNYMDLNASWQMLKFLKVSATINNAFNRQPPLVGTGVGPSASNYGNTFPSVYDVIGRRYTLSATATF